MAYVSPSGTIELMRGVNLDNRYMHTLYFSSPTARDNYFTTLVTNRFTNQMYTRVNEGVIKVRAFCEDINNVTYLRFQNRPNGRYYLNNKQINDHIRDALKHLLYYMRYKR